MIVTAFFCSIQVDPPSEEVKMRPGLPLLVSFIEPATSLDPSEDEATADQYSYDASLRSVHVAPPSEEVQTESPQATRRRPSSEDARDPNLPGVACSVQVIPPSSEVSSLPSFVELAKAASRRPSAEVARQLHSREPAASRIVQVAPPSLEP